MTISDEELAKIALAAHEGAVDANEWWDDLTRDEREGYLDIARAVRAALAEPITPLAPGDFEDISDRLRVICDAEDGDFGLMIWAEGEEGPGDYDQLAYLDADGVRALRDTCDRWLAGQAGDDDE